MASGLPLCCNDSSSGAQRVRSTLAFCLATPSLTSFGCTPSSFSGWAAPRGGASNTSSTSNRAVLAVFIGSPYLGAGHTCMGCKTLHPSPHRREQAMHVRDEAACDGDFCYGTTPARSLMDLSEGRERSKGIGERV